MATAVEGSCGSRRVLCRTGSRAQSLREVTPGLALFDCAGWGRSDHRANYYASVEGAVRSQITQADPRGLDVSKVRASGAHCSQAASNRSCPCACSSRPPAAGRRPRSSRALRFAGS
eukprot:3417705-Prymnesium_polylepis.1